MPTPTPDVISYIVAMLVTLTMKLLKLVSPKFEATPAFVKQLTAVGLAVLPIGFACGWHFGQQDLWNLVYAVIGALGAHSLVLGPLERDAEERKSKGLK